MTSRDIVARCRAALGAFTAGLAHGEAGLRIAEAVHYPPSLIEACHGLGDVSLRTGDVYQALPWLERGLEVCSVWDLPLLLYVSSSVLGYAYVLAGRPSDALPRLEQYVSTEAMQLMRGMRPLQTHCHRGLGTLYATIGQREQARTARRGYWEATSSMQRYPYIPGKVYDIYSAPSHPTTTLLPPGERLATSPVINGEEWEVGAAEMGTETTRQEAVVLRPLKAGLETTMPLLTQAGRAFFCSLRSFETTSMVAVTWELPAVRTLTPESPSTGRPTTTRTAPAVDVSRLHTAYAIDRVSGTPP